MKIFIKSNDEYLWEFDSDIAPNSEWVISHPEKGDFEVMAVRMVLERPRDDGGYARPLRCDRIECEAVAIEQKHP